MLPMPLDTWPGPVSAGCALEGDQAVCWKAAGSRCFSERERALTGPERVLLERTPAQHCTRANSANSRLLHPAALACRSSRFSMMVLPSCLLSCLASCSGVSTAILYTCVRRRGRMGRSEEPHCNMPLQGCSTTCTGIKGHATSCSHAANCDKPGAKRGGRDVVEVSLPSLALYLQPFHQLDPGSTHLGSPNVMVEVAAGLPMLLIRTPYNPHLTTLLHAQPRIYLGGQDVLEVAVGLEAPGQVGVHAAGRALHGGMGAGWRHERLDMLGRHAIMRAKRMLERATWPILCVLQAGRAPEQEPNVKPVWSSSSNSRCSPGTRAWCSRCSGRRRRGRAATAC